MSTGQVRNPPPSTPGLEPGPWCKLTAIVRRSALEPVERRLQALGIPGVTVTRVKGYGEYADYFTSDWMGEHVRLEVFLPRDQAERARAAVIESARTGAPGDGIVVVLPVESFTRIRTGESVGARGNRP